MSVLINKSDFDTLCANVSSRLSDDSLNANIVNLKLESFLNGIATGTLKGEMWSTIGQKYTEFSNVMQSRKNVAENFSSVISSAQATIDGAWDSRFGNELEDSKLEEVGNEIKQVEDQIISLQNELANVDSTSQLYASLSSQLTSASNRLSELEDLLNSIINFLGIYQGVCESISSAADSLQTSFVSSATVIQPSVI